MQFNRFLAATAIAAVMAGGAAAQTATPNNGMNQPAPPAATDQSAAPAANQSAAPAAATVSGPVASSPTPAEQAYTLKAGDPNVVSNAPVADTPANRQQYGAPMSNAGRHTKPTGD